MDREQPFVPAPARMNELRSEALRQTLRQDWRCHLYVLSWVLSAVMLGIGGQTNLMWLLGPAMAGWVGLGVGLSQPRLAAAIEAERQRSATLAQTGELITAVWR